MRALVVALLAAAEAACYSPFPTCEEHDDTPLTIDFDSSRLQLLDGEAFVLDGRTYASCTDLCGAQSGALHTDRCTPPTNTVGHAWQVTCRVDVEACHNATILDIGAGRRSEPRPRSRRSPRGAGAWLAEAARLEAASVTAFDRLARELAFHRAPTALVRGARRAEADEVRHTRMMSRLAIKRGSTPDIEPPRALPIRPLLAVAIENAVEGCVSETLGAALACVQARRARDPRMRAAMTTVARDETRHAVLAWEVLEWTLETLAPDERAQVLEAVAAAVDRVSPGSFTNDDPEVRTELGLPDEREAKAMLASFAPLQVLRAVDVDVDFARSIGPDKLGSHERPRARRQEASDGRFHEIIE